MHDIILFSSLYIDAFSLGQHPITLLDPALILIFLSLTMSGNIHNLIINVAHKLLPELDLWFHGVRVGFRFLGTSGQNIDDLEKYSEAKDKLAFLERTLKWRHLAPTAPNTLGRTYTLYYVYLFLCLSFQLYIEFVFLGTSVYN